ncbi:MULTISPECIES: YggT family protein [Aerococcus]|uniref:YggT family protein n=4 Tax=Lactobacillales TaxID=186826 RepID=A0ABT4C3R1_9LACT|nr:MULTISPECIES: YggT family protein [Aerococcus]AEA01068.1 YGGT family protein [Aerococcus sp. Group 1]AMB96655.1 cell division protein [Aerococcus urinae]KAA9235014.1 YggT family protein [Aerococcus mictus]KAA9242775.1 YggT family protein [Aerococcus urinae]KAA9293705.1 YggT family protein [Aerococcus mictus]
MINFIQNVLQIYISVIIVWALLSWLPGARQSRLGQLLDRIVRPYIDWFERIIPPIGGISFSPIVAILVLELAISGLNVLR